MFKVPEERRFTQDHSLGSNSEFGNNGLFIVPLLVNGKEKYFNCIASNKEGWDHVSVSIRGERRCPTWEEMCRIKDLFWDESDTVIQYHPAKSDYVNVHEYCLHLWRNQNQEIELPPIGMV